MLAELATRFRGQQRDAVSALHALCVSAASGKQVDAKKLDAARVDAGWTSERLANHLESLEKRKAAHDEHESRDWDAERKAAVAKNKQVHAELEAAQQALADTQRLLRELHEQASRAGSAVNRIPREETESANARRDVLRETGGGKRWDDFVE